MVSCIDTDLYADLGLKPGAGEDAIRQAFRRLAFELHPDRNPDPSAAEAFRRVRTAYETLLDPGYRAATEAERVAEEVLRAAATARRSRPNPVHELRPVPFTLNVGGLRLRAAAATRVALGGSAVAVLAVGLAALTGFAALFLVAATSFSVAAVAWLTRRHPVALLVYSDGFEDGRWPEAGRIGWADVYALDPDYTSGLLDLALSQPAAERLGALVGGPPDALVWQGDRPFYRLPLRTQIREAVVAIEARAGIGGV